MDEIISRPSENRYVETKAVLKELVDLGNELVHHFLQRFDVWDADGCIAAEAYLDESYGTIDGQYLALRDWAKYMDESRQLMASFIPAQQFEDAVFNRIGGMAPYTGQGVGIIACLREAETKLDQERRKPLMEAIRWIAETYSEPTRCGCVVAGVMSYVSHSSLKCVRKAKPVIALQWFGIEVIRGEPPRNRSKQ